MSGRKVALRIYVEPGKEDRCRLRDGFAQALDALGRAGVRPRIRSRHLHDRRGVRLQHGRDGEQGPQRLQRQIRAGLARDRDRQRLRPHRGHHRARVFPQLDRQPHHLPRLVPALPEGRPHRLPRPGVHLRPALARGRRGSPTCAGCARISSSRMPAPSPIRCGPSSIARSTTSTPRPSTRRAPRSCACSRRCSAPELFRKGMDLYFERHDGQAATVEQFVQCFADASEPRPRRSSCAGIRRPARPRSRRPATTTPAPKTYQARSRADDPADAGPADQGADGDPARPRPGRPRRPRPAADARRRPARSSAACWCSTKPAQSFVFTGVAERPVLSLNRGFSAPIKLTANLSADDLRVAGGARQRSVQPLAGGADAGDRAAGRQRGAAARRPGPRGRRGPARRARRDPRRQQRSSRPSSPRRSRRRAKPTSPARSAATSIRTRSSARARRCAR